MSNGAMTDQGIVPGHCHQDIATMLKDNTRATHTQLNEPQSIDKMIVVIVVCVEYVMCARCFVIQQSSMSQHADVHLLRAICPCPEVVSCACVHHRLAGRVVGLTGGAAVGERWGGPRLLGF